MSLFCMEGHNKTPAVVWIMKWKLLMFSIRKYVHDIGSGSQSGTAGL